MEGGDVTSWRSLLETSISESHSKNNIGWNYIQISTIEKGEPRCRTVGFRGFLGEGINNNVAHDGYVSMCDGLACTIKMCTDSRSKKVVDTSLLMAEMVWWFPERNEQYRIRGHLRFIGSNGRLKHDSNENDEITSQIEKAARKEAWEDIGDQVRTFFFQKSLPGMEFQEESDVRHQKEDDTGEGKDVHDGGSGSDGVPPPPENFLLMLLDPTNVDYLRLYKTSQYRQIDSRTQLPPYTWTSRRVNP